MKDIKIIFTIIMVLTVSACQKVVFKFTDETAEPVLETRSHFFAGGVFQEKEVNVSELCKNKKLIRLEDYSSFLDGVFSGITSGLYFPRTVKVYCR